MSLIKKCFRLILTATAIGFLLGTTGISLAATATATATPPIVSSSASGVNDAASSPKATLDKAKENLPMSGSVATTKESASEPLSEFPASRVWIVIAVILLMAGLFWALLYFQQRIEQAGYFGRIYHDTFRSMESTRLGTSVRQRWIKDEYLTDILLGRGQAGKSFFAIPENKRPEPADDLKRLAKELGREYELKSILRSMDPTTPNESFGSNPFGGEAVFRNSRTGGIGSSSRTGLSLTKETATVTSEQSDEATYWSLHEDFTSQVDAWLTRAKTSAWDWYQNDLLKVEDQAKIQADEAVQLTDLSAFRGRGPEFVLEFTAVVVIIFAAVILSVLGRLDNNQVGTLLAAIAGYVLGKGTSRASGNSADVSGQKPSPKV